MLPYQSFIIPQSKDCSYIAKTSDSFICFPLGCLYISSGTATIQVIYNRNLHKDLGRFLVVIMTFQPEIHSQERAHIQRSLNDQRPPPPVRNIDTKYRSQDTREAARDDHRTLSRPQDHACSACTAGAF